MTYLTPYSIRAKAFRQGTLQYLVFINVKRLIHFVVVETFLTYIFHIHSTAVYGLSQNEFHNIHFLRWIKFNSWIFTDGIHVKYLLKGTTAVLLVGFKPSTSKLRAQVPYHYATLPPMCIQTFSNSLLVGDISFS